MIKRNSNDLLDILCIAYGKLNHKLRLDYIASRISSDEYYNKRRKIDAAFDKRYAAWCFNHGSPSALVATFSSVMLCMVSTSGAVANILPFRMKLASDHED